jgi:hypothetical protein
MRIVLAALIALLPLGTAQAADSPYVLKLDKARYALKVPITGASAAAGATREDFRPSASAAAPIGGGEAQRWRMREHDYELRLADLRREKEAWRQRAELLESELRFYLSTTPTPLRGR